MSYEIPYKVTVNVPGLIDADGVDLTTEKAAAALEALAAQLRAEPQTLKSVFGDAGFSEVEDRWVVRSAYKSNSIRKADGSWVTVKSTDIDPADTMRLAEAANIGDLGEGAIWSKPEDIFGTPVLATLKDDLTMIVEQVDISEWLAKADVEDLEALVEDDWAYGYGADAIYHDLDEHGHPSAVRLSNFLALNTESPMREQVGFSVRVEDPDAAKAFLKEVNPSVFEQVFADEENAIGEP